MYGLQLLLRGIERTYRHLLAGPRSRTYNIQYVLTSRSISITHLTYIEHKDNLDTATMHALERKDSYSGSASARGERTMRIKGGWERRVAAPPMPERNDDDGEGEAVLHTWSPEDEAIGGGVLSKEREAKKG